MRQIIIAAAALIALAAEGHAAARIPAPVTVAVQLTGGLGRGARPVLPPADAQGQQVAQIGPEQDR